MWLQDPELITSFSWVAFWGRVGEGAVGSLCLVLYSVNDLSSWKKKKKSLKDADKDCKDCPSIPGSKWLIKKKKKQKPEKRPFDE
jgi:hypothetical protein